MSKSNSPPSDAPSEDSSGEEEPDDFEAGDQFSVVQTITPIVPLKPRKTIKRVLSFKSSSLPTVSSKSFAVVVKRGFPESIPDTLST